MRCRVCAYEATVPIGRSPDGSADWSRCLACGSDSSTIEPAAVAGDYLTESYRDHHHADDPANAAARNRAALDANVRWFRDWRREAPGPDFLDVGHLDGASLTAMQEDGWRVHGFDVNPHADYGPHTTIAPVFSASLFPRQYDAVMCREVIEHVDTWRAFLSELYRVTKPRGLCQIQTPRPTAITDPLVYQRHHLQIFSPAALELAIRRAGFEIGDRWVYPGWPNGQAWMLRRA